MAIYKYFNVSTGNLTSHNLKLLSKIVAEGANQIYLRPRLGITISAYEYGYFVSVPPEEGFLETAKKLIEKGLDPSLTSALVLARGNDCDLIRFDADGDPSELPQYEDGETYVEYRKRNRVNDHHYPTS